MASAASALLRLGLPNGLLPLSELKRDETPSVRDAPTRRQSNGETEVLVLIDPVENRPSGALASLSVPRSQELQIHR